MTKVLIVATSEVHINVFHIPYLALLTKMGATVDVAVEVRRNQSIPYVRKIYNLPFKRNLARYELLEAYIRLKHLLLNGGYEMVHCHTPIPASLTRFAARSLRKRGLIVMYTAHGFHFYKGAPWYQYKPFFWAERLLARWTYILSTIESEYYQIAKAYFPISDIHHMKGIGVDTTRFLSASSEAKTKVRQELNIENDDQVLIYVANMVRRKNHKFLLLVFSKLLRTHPKSKLLLAGSGTLMDELKTFSRSLQIDTFIRFVGFREDIPDLLAASDLAVSTSRHEGLGLALAEAMWAGLPVVASQDRGHRELVNHGETGFLFEQGNGDELLKYIKTVLNDRKLAKRMGDKGKLAVREFSNQNSLDYMEKVYRNNLRLQE